MRITWSVPIPGEPLDSGRGDLVRARQLMKALSAAGHEVQPVVASEGSGARAGVSVYRRGVRNLIPQRAAHQLRSLGRLALARSHAKGVAQRARSQGADLIVETQVHGVPSGALAAELAGLPLVLDDCSPCREGEALLDGSYRSTRRRFARQARTAGALLVSSRELARRLEGEGVASGKLSVVPNGVETSVQEPLRRETTRQELGVQDRVVVAFVGSFQTWHRLDLLVQATRPLIDSSPVHLLLVGEGREWRAVFEAVSDLGMLDRVTLTGMIPPHRLHSTLCAADIGVLPGSNEYGQPMKLMEYGAAGLPSVAPDLPPVREVLEHGSSGLLFAPGDATALRESLSLLVRDSLLRGKMGENARSAMAGRTWVRSANFLTDAIAPLLQKGVRP